MAPLNLESAYLDWDKAKVLTICRPARSIVVEDAQRDFALLLRKQQMSSALDPIRLAAHYLHGGYMIIRVLFLDTSALLKMFVKEDGTENMKWLTSPDTKIGNSLQFFVNDQVCSEFENKICEFEKNGRISKKNAYQLLDTFHNHYMNSYLKVIGKKPLLCPKKETAIDAINQELNLTPGKNDWDGRIYQSIIDALAYLDGESHPILVTCDESFGKKVEGKGCRVINPMRQCRTQIQSVFAQCGPLEV